MPESRVFDINGEVFKTWNPVTGCLHGCLYCWARMLAERLKRRGSKKYREGFTPMLHSSTLKSGPRGAGNIFVCDMGDMWGPWVPRDWIEKVLEKLRQKPEVTPWFFTKNPARYREFLDKMPENAVLGVTIETNREYDVYRSTTRPPRPFARYYYFTTVPWERKAVAVEPVMDFDVSSLALWIKMIRPMVVFIGYDNYPKEHPPLPEPETSKVYELVERIKPYTTVVLKTIRPPVKG